MIKNRQDLNQQLCTILSTLVGSYPDMRFSQILATFDFVMRDFEGHWKEEYYVEPDVILQRVKEAIERLK